MAETWIWSAAHNDHYRQTYENGVLRTWWANETKSSSEEDIFSAPARILSPNAVSNSNYTASRTCYTNTAPYSSIYSTNSIPGNTERPTITSLAKDCSKLFGEICEDFRNQQQENQELILRISNELDRFRLWMISFDVESGLLEESALSQSTSESVMELDWVNSGAPWWRRILTRLDPVNLIGWMEWI